LGRENTHQEESVCGKDLFLRERFSEPRKIFSQKGEGPQRRVEVEKIVNNAFQRLGHRTVVFGCDEYEPLTFD